MQDSAVCIVKQKPLPSNNELFGCELIFEDCASSTHDGIYYLLARLNLSHTYIPLLSDNASQSRRAHVERTYEKALLGLLICENASLTRLIEGSRESRFAVVNSGL